MSHNEFDLFTDFVHPIIAFFDQYSIKSSEQKDNGINKLSLLTGYKQLLN